MNPSPIRLPIKHQSATHQANLYSSSILGSPEFFWEAEGFEPLFRQAYTYLDTEERLRILNKRLDIVNDLLDSLSDQARRPSR